MDYSKYPKDWQMIRDLVCFVLAENRCQFCQVINYSTGYWVKGEFIAVGVWGDVLLDTGIDLYYTIPIDKKLVTIFLGVAHLDQDTTNNDLSNLAALCQRCHLIWDMPWNIRKRLRVHWSQFELFDNHL